MEDDPDDLAAAFFAAQAAKEQQKAKLPTEDWVAAISSIRVRKKLESDSHSTGASVTDGDGAYSSRDEVLTSNEGGFDVAVSNWLVTTIPNVPTQTERETDFSENELNGIECNAFNLFPRDCNESLIVDGPFLPIFAQDVNMAERRERIKQYLVQKLLLELDSERLREHAR